MAVNHSAHFCPSCFPDYHYGVFLKNQCKKCLLAKFHYFWSRTAHETPSTSRAFSGLLGIGFASCAEKLTNDWLSRRIVGPNRRACNGHNSKFSTAVLLALTGRLHGCRRSSAFYGSYFASLWQQVTLVVGAIEDFLKRISVFSFVAK